MYPFGSTRTPEPVARASSRVVVVRQDVSLRIHQDARAGRARLLARAPAKIALVELLTEELFEPLRGFLRRAGRRFLRRRAHVHHGRRDAVGDGGERVLQRPQHTARIGLRRRALLLRRGRALLRPGGGGKKQREEKGDEWVHRRLGPLLYRPRSDSARGTRASSSTRRVRAVTRAAAPRRSFPIQMTAPPASTTGTRQRSQRGTFASIKSVLSRRSAPPNGTKRSPRRGARTTSGPVSSSASKATRPGSRGIA